MEAYAAAGGLPDYYRCDVINRTEEKWLETGTTDLGRGIFCLLFGIVGEVLYIPCLTYFDFRFINSHSAWGGGCLGCFFLVLTRLVDVLAPRLYKRIFAGEKIFFTFALIFLYILWFIFYTKPILFNSSVGTWFLNPMIYDNGEHSDKYTSTLIIANNLITVTSTLFLCVTFFIAFWLKLKSSFDFKIDSKQKQLMIQSCLICFNNVILAAIYVYIQFFPVYPWMVVMAQSCWQFSSAGGNLVFYGINKTVRERILILLRISKPIKIVYTTSVASKKVFPFNCTFCLNFYE